MTHLYHVVAVNKTFSWFYKYVDRQCGKH